MTLSDDERSRQLAEVLRLRLTEGKGIRAIAKATKLGRKKVRKLLGLASDGKAKPVPQQQRSSILAPYDEAFRKTLDDCADIRAPAMLDRLREAGYQGGITVVRDHLRVRRPRPKQEAFFTRSYGPGRLLQVDWADFGYAIPGCARRVSAFVAALAYSRYLFIVFTLSQAMGSFLRCMDAALDFFGGRTLLDIFDNMKTVVQERAGKTVVINPRFLEYARARGLGVHACTPYRPTEKPYVERPIGFVRTRFWPGRRPTDLFSLNAQAAKWRRFSWPGANPARVASGSTIGLRLGRMGRYSPWRRSAQMTTVNSLEQQIRRMTPVAVAASERPQVAKVSQFLGALAHGRARKAPACFLVGAKGQQVAVPEAVFYVLERVAEVLASGDSVTVVPVGKELTTQQAADLLNVSRQYLVRLLDAERIPHTKTGRHRRLLIEDVLAFKEKRDQERKGALQDLSAITEELGGYGRELK